MQLLAILLLTLSLQSECPGITVVRNGLAAFAAGETRIGPYTNAHDYLIGGIDYIARRCPELSSPPNPLSITWRGGGNAL